MAIGFFLSTFVTTSAMAGSYAVGIIAATGSADTTGHEQEGGGDSERTEGSASEDLKYGSIFAEHTWGEIYGITLGASYTPFDASLGAKSRTDTTTEPLPSGSDDSSGTYSAKADISEHVTIYVEPTFMPTQNFGVYIKGGVSRVIVNSLEDITLGENSSVYGNETVLGGMFGLGMKAVHDSGLLFKLEYTKTIYETVKMTSTTGNKNIISADPEIEAFRLAVGYQF